MDKQVRTAGRKKCGAGQSRAGLASGRWWLVVLLGLLLAAPVVAQQRPKKKTTTTTTTKAKPSKTTSRSTRPATSRSTRPKSKAQLERERRANLRQIQQTSQALDQTQARKKVSLGQLNVITAKLTEKKQVIRGISTQLQGIETNVHQTARQVLQT